MPINSSNRNLDFLYFDELTFADVNAVPEPATMLLLGTGLAGAAAAVRRRSGSPPALEVAARQTGVGAVEA